MRITLTLLVSLTVLACASTSSTATPADTAVGLPETLAPSSDAAADVATAIDAVPDGAPPTDSGTDTEQLGPEWFGLTIGPFTVPAYKERFLCITQALPEGLVIDRIELPSRPVVHHAVIAETMTPDPVGQWECDVLFKTNWLPIFVAGKGDSVLQAPQGAGFKLAKGTQVTSQLHLLNPTGQEVTETLVLKMRRAPTTGPISTVRLATFGTMNVYIPPKKDISLEGICKVDENITLFAAFPHMHLHGTHLNVKLVRPGKSPVQVFERAPYDFDDQHLETIDLTLSPGDEMRVTCGYFNTSDKVVTFGESTTNEMCFFIAFATGGDPGDRFAGCLGNGGGSGFLPEACGKDPANAKGIGKSCTAGGNECPSGLACTKDLVTFDMPGMCIALACAGSADCGDGAVCCSPAQAGGKVDICLPKSCQFDGCPEKLP